jgi:hypothetical protein
VSRKLTGPVVIATHNPGKLAEMRDLLAPFGIASQSAGELGLGEPRETGKTFAANARIKALAAANATGNAATPVWWSRRSAAIPASIPHAGQVSTRTSASP